MKPLNARTRRLLRFIPLWIAAGICQIPFIAEFVYYPSPWMTDRLPILLGCHLLSILLMWISVSRKQIELSWGRSFVFWTMYLPAFGWLLSGILFINHQFQRPTFVFEEDLESPDVQLEVTRFLEAFEREKPLRQRIRDDLNVMPIVDILRGNNVALKRGAIERLVQLKTREAIQVLRQFKTDPSSEVRFHVNSALMRVKKSFDDELKAAQREMKQNYYKISARFFLAKEYLNYAQSGLLEDKTAQYYELEAMQHLEAVVQSLHGASRAYWTLIELYARHNEWDKAIDTLAQLEKSRHGETLDPSEVIKTKIKLYFFKRDIEHFRACVSEYKNIKTSDPEWNALIAWWDQGL